MANNKTYTKEQAVKIITQCANEYETELRNKRFVLAYEDNNKLQYKIVGFKAGNFLHLTGVDAKTSATRFYEKCLDRKLSKNDFEFDKHNQCHLKLTVLPMLSKMFYNHSLRGDFARSGLWIEVDYFIGTTNRLLSLGFREGNGADYPVSLYQQDVKQLVITPQKVLGVWRLSDEETLNTYIAKDYNADELAKQLIAIGAPL